MRPNHYIYGEEMEESEDKIKIKELTADWHELLINSRPRDLVSIMDKYVIGQDKAKKILAVALYNHIKRIGNNLLFPSREKIKKNNIMMVGPTGSGKTYLIECICKELDIPFVIVDATTFTQTGYYGDDVRCAILELLKKTGNDAEMAARGVVFIDEIDKLAGQKDKQGVRDIGVQTDFLKLIEGTVASVPTSRSYTQARYIDVDTSNILFIAGGAFSGLEEHIAHRTGSKAIGFAAVQKLGSELLADVTPQDLVSFGLLQEFVGRFPNMAVLNKLTADNLVDILTKERESLVNQYINIFWHDGITLKFEPDALNLIAETALQENTGARGLHTIMERAMLDLMFNAPGSPKAMIKVTKEIIKQNLERIKL